MIFRKCAVLGDLTVTTQKQSMRDLKSIVSQSSLLRWSRPANILVMDEKKLCILCISRFQNETCLSL